MIAKNAHAKLFPTILIGGHGSGFVVTYREKLIAYIIQLSNGYIESLAVDPMHQYRYIGTTLLDLVLLSNPALTASLHVKVKRLRAIALYKSFDFQKCGQSYLLGIKMKRKDPPNFKKYIDTALKICCKEYGCTYDTNASHNFGCEIVAAAHTWPRLRNLMTSYKRCNNKDKFVKGLKKGVHEMSTDG